VRRAAHETTRLARCHGFEVAAGPVRVGVVETPVFAGPAVAPDYLIVRTEGPFDGRFRVVPAALVVDVDEERRIVVLGVDVPAVANLPERLPLVSHRTVRA
jgi:hypothetical protein